MTLFFYTNVTQFPNLQFFPFPRTEMLPDGSICSSFFVLHFKEKLTDFDCLSFTELIMSDIARNDEWNSDRPQEERKYDGPAEMDPDGVIDSNWDEVNNENIYL